MARNQRQKLTNERAKNGSQNKNKKMKIMDYMFETYFC